MGEISISAEHLIQANELLQRAKANGASDQPMPPLFELARVLGYLEAGNANNVPAADVTTLNWVQSQQNLSANEVNNNYINEKMADLKKQLEGLRMSGARIELVDMDTLGNPSMQAQPPVEATLMASAEPASSEPIQDQSPQNNGNVASSMEGVYNEISNLGIPGVKVELVKRPDMGL